MNPVPRRPALPLTACWLVMWLAVGACGKEQAQPDTAAADAQLDVTDVQPLDDVPAAADIDASVDAAPSNPCQAAGAPGGSNLLVHIEGSKAFKGAYLRLDLLASDGSGLSVFRVAAAATLYDGPLTGPPMDWRGVAPVGTWLVRAMVSAKPGDMETSIGGGISCSKQGMATVQISIGGCVNATLPLVTDDQVDDASELCGGAGAGNKGLFKPLSTVITPPTQAGGAHLMNGVVTADRLWVAASQDGLVSFDFPGQTPTPAPKLNNWQVHGQAPCNRLHRAGGNIFCTSRRGQMGAIAFNPQTLEPTAKAAIQLPVGSLGEGMADLDGRLYVAAHGGGVLGYEVAAPHAAIKLEKPPLSLDAWDVAIQDKKRLVVANGGQGVAVLGGADKPQAKPTLLGSLALPGVAAFLAVHGDQVAVGALNGGLHVLQVQADGQPQLQGSFSPRGLVYGVAFQGDLVLAAAGSHLLAVDRPGGPGDLVARGLMPSFYHAMDIEPFGEGVLASEFQGVRHLAVDANVAKGPLLEAPMHIMSPLTALGEPIKGALRLRNLGAADLHINQILFSESPVLGDLPTVIAKDLVRRTAGTSPVS